MGFGKSVPRALAAVALIGALVGVQAARATPYVVVDTVQAPAWVERNEQRLPLVAGQELKSRDRVITGADARVVLRLAEGSAVKLGENANLRVDALGRREGNVFTAALDVAKGAFRFTTGIFSRAQNHRAVNVRIATITAGIRGTDLWGSSDAERDLVCLIEGRITVMHPQAEPVQMSDPLSFYVAPKGEAPKPVASVDPQQLALWSQETEPQAGKGLLRRGGLWKVSVATVENEVDALALYDRLRVSGYPAKIRVRGAAGAADAQYRYELLVPQLATRADASFLAQRLRQELALESAHAAR